MPVFEYRCDACETTVEEIILGGEPPPDRCSTCGGALRRLWSRVGIQLVGWGFAKNDALLPEGSDNGRRRAFKQVKDKASELFD